MKGIILAGGRATRLYPVTVTQSKQLLPVYDKPMIYYAISTLMFANIRDVLIISTPADIAQFSRLLGTGEDLGMRFHYAEQPRPEGVAQALIIAEDYLAGQPCALALGDNLFYGDGFPEILLRASTRTRGATIFTYRVTDPQRYGVVTLDDRFRPVSIEEKPEVPKSNWAVTGLYFYDERAPSIAKGLTPSDRGELEISDLNRAYLNEGTLHVEVLGRGYAWLDTGTPDALLQAAEFVRTLEVRQGLKISCIEEVAMNLGFISASQALELSNRLGTGDYATYLRRVALEHLG